MAKSTAQGLADRRERRALRRYRNAALMALAVDEAVRRADATARLDAALQVIGREHSAQSLGLSPRYR